MGIFTFSDLLYYFPYRHIDKSKIHKIAELNAATEFAQVQGRITYTEIVGEKAGKRLIAHLKDDTGSIELIWFRGISWVQKNLNEEELFIAFGRLSFFMGKPQLVHPELESVSSLSPTSKNPMEPVYSTTEKLKAKGLGGKQIGKLVFTLLNLITPKEVPENIPSSILQKGQLMDRFQAVKQLHFPATNKDFTLALRRLKFEELFIAQVKLTIIKSERHRLSRGVIFSKVGNFFNTYFKDHLPFELTGAQKSN